MSYRLVSERPELADEVERMLDRAFGPGRFAKVSERVRERGARFEASLSRVALDEARVLGCCRIFTMRVGPQDVFLLGPLAVAPDARREGLGAALTRDAVAACRAAGGAGIVLVGAHSFFGPIGFSLVPKGRIHFPGPVDPARTLWLELRPGGLDRVAGEIGAPTR
jgi:predicted N-acetyltransferase YhbS